MATITKATIQGFRSDFAEAMKALEAKYGVSVNLGNIRYTDNDFRSTVTCISKTATLVSTPFGNTVSSSKEGKKIGDTFTYGGTTYTITGFNPRAPKNALQFKDARGKMFKGPMTLLGK